MLLFSFAEVSPEVSEDVLGTSVSLLSREGFLAAASMASKCLAKVLFCTFLNRSKISSAVSDKSAKVSSEESSNPAGQEQTWKNGYPVLQDLLLSL